MGRVIKKADILSRPISISKDAVAAAKTLVEAQRVAHRLREEGKRDVIELAIHMANRIVGRTVETTPSVLDEMYQSALDRAPKLEDAVLEVHPQDRKASRIDLLADQSGFSVKDDPTLERGGCRFSARGVEVDATVATALSLFGRSLKGSGIDGSN